MKLNQQLSGNPERPTQKTLNENVKKLRSYFIVYYDMIKNDQCKDVINPLSATQWRHSQRQWRRWPGDEDQTLLTIDIRSIDTEGSTKAICPKRTK